jgi:hypothetical protein
MSRRIDPRSYRQAGDATDPGSLDDLQARAAKHERLTRGKPVKAFKDVLKKKMRGDDAEEEEKKDEQPEEEQKGQKAPLLGLDPNQPSHIASAKTKVIVKG